jgi:hypothetical protein
VLAACGGSGSADRPTTPVSTTPVSTALVSTTVPRTSPPATDGVSTSPEPAGPSRPDETPASVVIPCTFAAPDPSGEITHVEAGRLLSASGSGEERCLEDTVETTAAVRWSATGDRLLTSENVIVGPTEHRPSGIAAGNVDVSWSTPTGKALISIDPATDHLIWQSASSDETLDISFLARTDEAIYHPAGKGIAAVGMAEDGTYGVWLASNRGKHRQLITRIDDPSTPAAHLAFSSDGRTLYFIHRAVHSLVLDGLLLTELGVEGGREDNLVLSPFETAWANTTGPCNPTGSVMANGVDLRTVPRSPFDDRSETLQPVGWLEGLRLVVAARSQGCDGPADVWVWDGSSANPTFTKVGAGWDQLSVRAPHGPFVDLPTTIEQAAPG